VLPQLPEPVRHPSVVRAAVSPSAAVVTAAGVGIGLAEHSVVLAVVLGAGAWLGRMAVAVVHAGRQRRKGRPAPAAIDPWAVPEPWRQYVRQAVTSRQRFDQAVSRWPAGPLRDRLLLLQPQLWQATDEVWAVAQRGAALSGTIGGSTSGGGAARPSVAALSRELQQIQAERQRAGASERAANLARSEEAVATQLRAARRAETAQNEVQDRLRVLTARLDEAVTELLQLGLEPVGGTVEGSGPASAEAVAGSVDALLEEIGALHEGLREVGEASSPGSLGVAGPPAAGGALPPSPSGPSPGPVAGAHGGPEGPADAVPGDAAAASSASRQAIRPAAPPSPPPAP
jgi:hypothetical protein